MILLNRAFYIVVSIFLMIFGASFVSFSQCNFTQGPIGELCSSAIYICGDKLDGYKSKLPSKLSHPQQWVGVCGGNGNADNIVWFSFTPCNRKVTLKITPTNCTTINNQFKGIQAGFFTKCDRNASVACTDHSSNNGAITPVTLSYDNFEPGKTAYFFIDGYAGSVCEFEVKVIEGIDTKPVQAPDPAQLNKGSISGENAVTCSSKNLPLTYYLNRPECKVAVNPGCNMNVTGINPEDSICYVWEITPSVGRFFFDQDSTGSQTNIVFTESGTYTISAQTFFHPFYGGSCANASCGEIIKWTVVVAQPDTIINPYISICPGESFDFLGQQVTNDTILYDISDPCSVKLQRFKIERNKENILPLQFVCKGKSFLFQGINYSPGTFEVVDTADCSLVHKFSVQEFPIKIDSSLATQYICSGTSFAFQGNNYAPGTYEVLDIGDCAILHKFNVAVFEPKTKDLGTHFVCNGAKYLFQGKDYSPGTYSIADPIDCALSNVFKVEVFAPKIKDLGSFFVCNGNKYKYNGVEYPVGTYSVADSFDCALSNVFKVEVFATKVKDIGKFFVCNGTKYKYNGVEYPVGTHSVADSFDCALTNVFSVEVFSAKVNDLGKIFVCNGNKYLYQGVEYPTGSHSVVDPNDCAVFNNFIVENFPPKENNLGIKYICGGAKFKFQGNEFSVGSYAIQDMVDCALTNKFVVEIFPQKEIDLGIKYICSGQVFSFQGKNYPPGSYSEKDTSICDVINKFRVEVINISVGIQVDNNVLNCTRNSINAKTVGSSNGILPLLYSWRDQMGVTISDTIDIKMFKAGRYTVTAIYDKSGIACKKEEFVDITADYVKPTVKALIPTVRCLMPNEQNPEIVLSSSDIITTSEWILPLGQKRQGLRTELDSLNATSGKPYVFSAISLNGCRIDTSFIVPINFERAKISLIGDPLTCYQPKDTILLTTNINVDSIRWYKTSPQLAFYGSYPAKRSLEVDSPGTYKAEVLASVSKCWSDQNVSIEDKIKYPDLQLQNNINWQCNTKSIEITPIVNSLQDMSFEWETKNGKILGNPQNQKLTAGSVGVYSVNILDKSNGCEKKGSLSINLDTNTPSDIEYNKLNISCFGQKDGMITISKTIGGYGPYEYFVNGNKLDKNTLPNLAKGEYTLQVRDKYDCIFEEKTIINEPIKFSIEAPLEISIFYSESAKLNFSANYNDDEIADIKWTNNKGEIIGRDFELIYPTTLSDVVNVEVTTINGCIATSKVKINVDNEIKFYFPNIFSPNSDGINDKLEFFKNKIPMTLGQISIFDRYGNRVFYTKTYDFNNSMDGWDGTFNGKNAEVGVYVLMIDYIDFMGERQVIKKDVTLVR